MRNPPIGKKRAFLFSLATLLIGISLLTSVELGLRFFDLGNPDLLPDPFVGFSSTRPLFELNAQGTRYEIAPSRKTFFYYDSFAAEKPDNEVRIFCLGGSTVAGRPFGIETAFTTWLELGLEAADPNKSWEVVNCGGVSYASYRLVPVLEEVLDYSPDLIVLMTGHNEFLEDRTYRHIKRLPALMAVPYERLTRTRTFTLLRGFLEPLRSDEKPGPTILPTEVDALLDYKGGLENYHRDPDWRAGVIEHFEANLRRMVGIAERAGVPILLVNPGCNLRDTPPFKSERRNDLSDEEIAEWTSLREQAEESRSTDPNRSLELLMKAVALDNRHAGTLYRLGRTYDSLGRTDLALEAYEKAKEEDICPLRILEPMNRAILDLARKEEIPLVDARTLLIEQSVDGIPGDDVYLDHVHPTIENHQRIANAILERMGELGMVEIEDGWIDQRDRAFADHLQSLNEAYFAQGQRRLERLRGWAAGRSDIEAPPGERELTTP